MKTSALLRSASVLVLGLASLASGGCAAEAPSDTEEGNGAVTSNDGSPLEFSFNGELVTTKNAVTKQAVLAQLQYLQGMLTTDVSGNAQFGFATLTNVRETVQGDTKRLTYTAAVPVVWPKSRTAPSTYELNLPKDTTDLAAFNEKYDGKCGKNEYGVETFWHDYNPKASGCTLAAADVHKVTATVRAHPQATTNKYPEYNLVWADDSFDIVAVYGAISNTTDSDTGARDREAYLNKVKNALTNGTRTDAEPSGSILKESKVEGDITIGGETKKVTLTAYFVSELNAVGADFDEKYGPVSKKADLIVYSGHSGLGKNIKAMADKTEAERGKYQIVQLNGCQTLGYLQTTMHDKRIELNGAENDPKGTKYLDVILTGLPAYAEPIPTEQILFDTIVAQRKHWNQILVDFPARHLVAVVGEDDNTFTP